MITTNVILISDNWTEVKGKTYLHYFGRSPDYGVIELVFTNQLHYFFIKQNTKLPKASIIPKRKKLNHTTFENELVDSLSFDSYKDLKQYEKLLLNKGIQCYESDILPTRRFLMEHRINCEVAIKGELIQYDNRYRVINPKIKPFYSDFSELKSASIDIETQVSTGKLYSIAIDGIFQHSSIQKVFIHENQNIKKSDVISLCKDEKHIITEFISFIQNYDPDIIIGWNVVGFDLQFLLNKSEELNIPLKIGRMNDQPYITSKNSSNNKCKLIGRIVIDGPSTLRSSFFKFESFSLDNVSNEILGEKKLINVTSKDKIKEIDRLFLFDRQKLADYNLQDCILVSKIFKETELLKLQIAKSKISGMLLGDIGKSSASFDHFFMPEIHRKNRVAINRDDVKKDMGNMGGYVFEPTSGIHSSVFYLDFKSLYPTIIQTFKIDPYSKLMCKKDTLYTPNQLEFSRTQHILPNFINELLKKRNQAKKDLNTPLSSAIKILMNSFYGVMGSEVNRFFHTELAKGITGTAKYILLETKAFISKMGHEVIYGDTDSLFIKIKDKSFSKDNYQHYGKMIVEKINKFWITKLEEEFELKSYLEIEYEEFFQSFLLPKSRSGIGAAKKRYSGLKLDGSVHFTGMESSRSDWSPFAKNFQSELYKKVFTNTPYSEWIESYISDLKDGKLDSALIFTKRIRKPLSSYQKMVPPHIQAARKLESHGRTISYVITKRGPIPIEQSHKDIDYDYYIFKQLAPIADSILVFKGTTFKQLIDRQIDLFD